MLPKNSAWIVRPRVRDNARLRLFCFPHAGAGSVIFRDWHNDFPDTVDVCLVEPPGRLARRHEPSAASVQEFATVFDAAVPPLLDLPIALFGYSLGALMAFEWARTLRRDHGLDVKSLIVAAAKSPQSPRRLPVITHEPQPIFLR
jgi:medium-chain acyl-[acyl-carrier-protein] hydrolase